jgi:glycosyltransferase involved in cell wall biosynthesis
MVAIGQQPLVSIITPVYNGSRYLEDLIQSVLQQNYPHIEHIIIDDGSTDDGATVAILRRYPHLRWWSRENKGQYATLNEGLASAKGTVLGIICADDMYTVPSTISSVVKYWQSHPECGFVYGRFLLVDSSAVLLPYQTHFMGPFATGLLRYTCFISHCSLFVAKEIVVNEAIWFDPSFRCSGDWDWIIRLSKTGHKFGHLDQPLALYRIHGDQISQTATKELKSLEHLKILQKYGTNYYLYLLVKRLLRYRYRILRKLCAIRTR